jgi:hypothetical protein
VVLAKSLLRRIQAHTALAEDSGGGGVLRRIQAYTAHVGVEEMVVFSIVEYERTHSQVVGSPPSDMSTHG